MCGWTNEQIFHNYNADLNFGKVVFKLCCDAFRTVREIRALGSSEKVRVIFCHSK